ncbi:MAG: hypothetical protein ABJC26_06460 [Gemmatimonadaceae bacterium]
MTLEICYLCGIAIEGVISRDHVPPQQLFAPAIRKQFKLTDLITRPSHPECNNAYGRDEEYAINAMTPLARGSIAADALAKHHADRFQAGKSVGLGKKILASFDNRPSGLHLPGGRVAMKVEGARIRRVMWKIVRGLWSFSTTPYFRKQLLLAWRPENR